VKKKTRPADGGPGSVVSLAVDLHFVRLTPSIRAMPVDFSRLFLMNEGHRSGSLRAHIDMGTGTHSFAVLRGQAASCRPPRVVRDGGTRVYDLIGTGGVLWLISPRMRELLVAARISGWRTQPVELDGARAEPLRGYELFIVHGRCGPINNQL